MNAKVDKAHYKSFFPSIYIMPLCSLCLYLTNLSPMKMFVENIKCALSSCLHRLGKSQRLPSTLVNLNC